MDLVLIAGLVLTTLIVFALGLLTGVVLVFHVEQRAQPRLVATVSTSGPPPATDAPAEKVRINAEVPQHPVWTPTEAMRRAHRAVAGVENS